MRKALFLDRDGVINEDTGYVHRIEEVRFIDGIFELCRAAQAKGYLIVVVTNQAGIGRGYYTHAQFDALMRWMSERFAEEGVTLAAVYHCPHHPEHGLGEYKKLCEDRKPGPGMFLRARDELRLELAASVLVGDKETDIQAGKAAGVGQCVLFAKTAETQADRLVTSLHEISVLL